jgi:hypothetical protein
MNRKAINILLAALAILNIMDGDYGWLDIPKFILIILCAVLNNRRES